MAQNAGEILQAHPSLGAYLSQLAGKDLINLNGQIISQAAARGDKVAITVLTRGARALGVGIGNAANLINPERIVLGGGVTRSGALFWDTVRYWARQTALPQVSLQILPAGMGDDAPLWGAVSLADGLLPGVQIHVAE
jgi:glucokinase